MSAESLDYGRMAFKKETLLRSFSSVVSKLSQLDLPATVIEIRVFGGILRDKPRLHDIDAICLYFQTKRQQERWTKFRKNFSSIDLEKESRRPINELMGLLSPFYDQGVRFDKAVISEELSKALSEKGVEPQWAACFSWTDILNNSNGFFPNVNRVMWGMLLRGTKGLSFMFAQRDDFLQGKWNYSRMNTVLAWRPDKPDIAGNLLEQTLEDKADLIVKELDKFLNVILELKQEYQELGNSLSNAPVKLTFEDLEKKHAEILRMDEDSYAELLVKCEKARNEMRRLTEEIAMLKTLKWIISVYDENLTGAQVACFALERQTKYEVKEARAREILETLGLP